MEKEFYVGYLSDYKNQTTVWSAQVKSTKNYLKINKRKLYKKMLDNFQYYFIYNKRNWHKLKLKK